MPLDLYSACWKTYRTSQMDWRVYFLSSRCGVCLLLHVLLTLSWGSKAPYCTHIFLLLAVVLVNRSACIVNNHMTDLDAINWATSKSHSVEVLIPCTGNYIHSHTIHIKTCTGTSKNSASKHGQCTLMPLLAVSKC